MAGNIKKEKRIRRKLHIRKTLTGTADRPRLVVNRSNQHLYAQIVNDENHVTLLAASDKSLKEQGKSIKVATELGKLVGESAKKQGITKLVFDRNGYKYHGKIKALADAVREAGIDF